MADPNDKIPDGSFTADYDPATGHWIPRKEPSKSLLEMTRVPSSYELGSSLSGGSPMYSGGVFDPQSQQWLPSRTQPQFAQSPMDIQQTTPEYMPSAQQGQPPRIEVQQGVQQGLSPEIPSQPQAPTLTPKETQQVKAAHDLGMRAALQGYVQGQNKVGLAKGEMDGVNREQEQFQKLQEKKDSVRQEQMAKLDQVNQQLDQMPMKDFWADKSTGSKIAAGLAVALGAYSSAMTGGPNAAMNIIDNAINRDMMLQKEQYERAKDRGARIKSVYGTLIDQLGDDQAAKATMMNMYYKQIDTKLKIQEDSAQDEVRKMQIAQMRQQMGMQAQQAQWTALERMTKLQMMGGTAKASEINPMFLSEEDQKRFVKDKDFGGLAPDSTSAQKARESISDYRTAKDIIGQLQAIANQPNKSLSFSARQQASTLATVLKGKLRKELVGEGAVSESEWKLLNSVIANPTELTNPDINIKTALRTLSDVLDTGVSNRMSAYGLTTQPIMNRSNSIMVQIEGQQPQMILKQNLPEAQKRAKAAGKNIEVINGQPY